MRNRYSNSTLFVVTVVVAGITQIAAPALLAYKPPKESATVTDIVESDPEAAAAREMQLISNARQLTFEGKRAGEGYFSKRGDMLVFQSERQADNPFFQIYLMDLEFGDVERISPGHGKTTCAWIHPSGSQVLFASTHDDPKAVEKQKAELEFRASGKQRRYSWDYDEHFDIYSYDLKTKKYANLTNARGYCAEGSWSPDGSRIVFASNRNAYAKELTKEQQKQFEIDPASMIDIFIMNANGTNVRQLTETPGYDGGPFFSPDGSRICWRRFSENGATAEVMTMNIDGSDQRKLTDIGAMSWAPYYHPSGKYLIFTTNLHGFANFELYLIDVDGKSKPVRATYTAGFDGLPVFTPDGKRLAWTTNRTAAKQSQIFMADWDHAAALKRLKLASAKTESADPSHTKQAVDAGKLAANDTTPQFDQTDIKRHVEYLCSPKLAGRMTGEPGEHLATAYVATYLQQLGLSPAGADGGWFDPFEFTAGVALGKTNQLVAGEQPYKVNKDWRPVAFSKTGSVGFTPIVFAGYGLSAPAGSDNDEYDSFVHLDVKDKWVMVFRYMPEQFSTQQRQSMTRYASLRYKAMLARDKGARGLIVVTGPQSKVNDELVPLRYDGSLAGTSIPVISVSNKVAANWLKTAGKDIVALQKKLDTGDLMMGFEIKGTKLGAHIEIEQVKRTGRNVLGRLAVADKPTNEAIIVGAHIDHLGVGKHGSSLAHGDDADGIHFGADDNASGVAGLLEIAEYLSRLPQSQRSKFKRDIIFAAWSGEELGLLGSSHYVKSLAASSKPAHPHAAATIYPKIAACLNMDMIGRLDSKLILQGIGSSSIWRGEVERRNVPVGLPITLQDDSYVPTDASVFFMRGVPILSAFTGAHNDYHTPRDTPDKLNYKGAANVAKLMGLITRSLALRDNPPDYVAQAKPETKRRAHLRAYLGTIPDYAESDVKGLKLSGVAKAGPGAKGGLKAGDVITKLAGKKIENIYDYTYAIEALKIGQPVDVVVNRGGKEVKMKVTPGSRE